MNPRVKFSLLIVALGLINALVPYKQNMPGAFKPSKLLQVSLDDSYILSVDRVAKAIVQEDSTYQLIDLREPLEYRKSALPGAVNIPYRDLLDKNYEGFFDHKQVNLVLYSNGEILSAQAWSICTARGYKNIFIMQGGMNEWVKTVMNTNFEGKRITAKENALYEARLKARKLYVEINSLPDSLKFGFLKNKKANKKKLDGGCG